MNQTSSLESIFFAALAKPSPVERAAFLDEACGGDDELRRRVERMLAAQSEAGSFLESPAADLAVTTDPTPLAERPGTRIGPYRLLQQIGEGGMGVVFMAEQTEPLQRTVALKIIKPGMDTRQVIARFKAERQALAMMEHPNIAKVLDAGTTDSGRPYFVMELVKGVPITKYCDQQRHTVKVRLELMITVCQAIQHAHQKGIIHRDLKPSNVLVAEYDGAPVPKVIDFGVAKATTQRLTEKTMFTEYGQLIGTFEYMSPEQARFNQLDVDTRSDIYSLGVLLYELLTGSTPFEKQRLETVAFDETLRIIREEEPPKPSTKLSSSDTLASLAANRHTEPVRLSKEVRGELDWIVMKCLEKDRNRRYETANSIARDVDRFLLDDPVEACPPSAVYRLQKFTRRNRAVLLTVGLVAAALLMGTVLSVSQAVRAKQAGIVAEVARVKAEANARAARQAVDEMYTQVAEKWLAHQPQMEPIQRVFLEKALRFYTAFAQEPGTEPAVRCETARAYRRIAEIQHRLGQPAEAENAFRNAIDHMQILVDEFPGSPEYSSELAATLHKLGVLLGDTGRYPEEERVHRQALVLNEKLLTEFPNTVEYRRDVGRGYWYVGQVLAALHRREEAEKEFRSALAFQNNLVSEFPTSPEYRHHLAQTYLRLGLALRFLDQPEEYHQALTVATEILESLSVEFPALPEYRNELANVHYWHVGYCQMRNIPLDQSLRYLNRAIALQEQLVAEHPSVADYRYDWFRSQKTLGRMLMKAGKSDDAEAVFRQAATMAEKLVAEAPGVHYYRGGLAYVNISLGELLTTTGRLADAEQVHREAIRLLEALVAKFPAVPQYAGHLALTYDKLAIVLLAAGRADDATEAQRQAVRVSRDHAVSPVRDGDLLDMESEGLTVSDHSTPMIPSTDHGQQTTDQKKNGR